MTPVDQEFLDGNEGAVGDCLRACVASILNLPRDAVPHFVRDHEHRSMMELRRWLAARGLEIVAWRSRSLKPNCLYLASGYSPREIYHMVVMLGSNCVHDPHPSRAGLVEADRIYLLVPTDVGEYHGQSPQLHERLP